MPPPWQAPGDRADDDRDPSVGCLGRAWRESAWKRGLAYPPGCSAGSLHGSVPAEPSGGGTAAAGGDQHFLATETPHNAERWVAQGPGPRGLAAGKGPKGPRKGFMGTQHVLRRAFGSELQSLWVALTLAISLPPW